MGAAPFTLRMSFDRSDRRSLECEIGRLIDMLDDMGPDPDLEDDGTTEPSLGWTKTMAIGNGRDLEEDLS